MAIFRNFWRSERGNVGVLFVFSAVPLIALAGGAVDLAKRDQYQVSIQSALDTAALVATRNLADQVSAGAGERLDYSLAEQRARVLFDEVLLPLHTDVALVVSHEGTKIRAEASLQMPTAFLPIIGVETLPIHGVAEGDFEAVTSTCVYVTAPLEKGLSLSASSQFSADCDVWVESSNQAAISAVASSDMKAEQICSNGGTLLRATSTVSPDPVPCQDPFRDPLEHLGRPDEAQLGCNFQNLTMKGSFHLRPGVYCGTTTISPSSHAILDPGTFVFRGGAFLVDPSSTASGENILLFFQGSGSGLHVGDGAHFEGHGLTDGEFAGLVVYVDRDCQQCSNVVNAGGTAAFEGTVYAPTAPFMVASRASTVSAPAALFIVYQMILESSASFTIATKFDGKVPASYVDAARLRLVK